MSENNARFYAIVVELIMKIKGDKEMKSKRKNRMKPLVLIGLGALALVVIPVLGACEDYPTKPVVIITGMAPGAAAGIGAQILGEGVQKYLSKPQSFMVNYKLGASGMIAMEYFMKQPADGYNLVWVNPNQVARMANYPHQYSFTKENLSYLRTIVTAPFVLAVSNESPYKTFEDFIDYAKSHPGELSYGHPGLAGDIHLYMEMFLSIIGIKLTAIPFAGGAPAVTALLGGHVTCYMGSTVTLGDHIKPGSGLRVLVALASKRLPDFPEVPTSLEKGYNVGDPGAFQMVVAKKGTPKPILDTLIKAFEKTIDDSNVRTNLINAGFIPLNWGPEETEMKFNREFESFREIYKKLGLKEK